MRADVYDAPRSFQVAEVRVRESGAGEALLPIELAGVCGSDVDIYEGRFVSRFPLTARARGPCAVEALGPRVSSLELSRRVVPALQATRSDRSALKAVVAP